MRLGLRLGLRLMLGLGGRYWGWTYFFGRVGGWLKKEKLKLNSTQVVVEVEVRVELGNLRLSYLQI